MTGAKVRAGGCLCGAVRYEVSGEPFGTEYCHCGMCRRVSGGPAALWMDLRASQVGWTRGQPKEYASSAEGRRGFCADCGSTLTYVATSHPKFVSLAITSLDDPASVVPARHIYVADQLPWFRVQDECPRFERGPGIKPPAD